MAYVGVHSAVGFSLVEMINKKVVLLMMMFVVTAAVAFVLCLLLLPHFSMVAFKNEVSQYLIHFTVHHGIQRPPRCR